MSKRQSKVGLGTRSLPSKKVLMYFLSLFICTPYYNTIPKQFLVTQTFVYIEHYPESSPERLGVYMPALHTTLLNKQLNSCQHLLLSFNHGDT